MRASFEFSLLVVMRVRISSNAAVCISGSVEMRSWFSSQSGLYAARFVVLDE